jgi:hypothetical protein
MMCHCTVLHIAVQLERSLGAHMYSKVLHHEQLVKYSYDQDWGNLLHTTVHKHYYHPDHQFEVKQ